ncbi:MAG: hypothetical protein AAGG75_25745 [Bacteroidota bacterium]
MKNIIFILLLCCTLIGQAQDTKFLFTEGNCKINGEVTVVLQDTDLKFSSSAVLEATDGTLKFTGTHTDTLSNEVSSSNRMALHKVLLDKENDVDLVLDGRFRFNDQFMFGGNGAKVASTDGLLFGEDASITGYDPQNHFYQEGIVTMQKENQAGAFVFPISSQRDSYTTLTITLVAGDTTDVSVNVLPNALDLTTNANFTSGVLDRTFLCIANGLSQPASLSIEWSPDQELPGFDRQYCGVLRYLPGPQGYQLPFSAVGPATGSNPYRRVGELAGGFTYTYVVGEEFLPHVQLEARTFLQGAFDATEMRDDLRTNGLLPLNEPYDALSDFTHVGRGGNEAAESATVFDQPGTDDDIVDWVMVELRDKDDSDVVIETKSALLQRDGDIVDMDGFSPLGIPVPDDDYYLSIRHRNHLGILSSSVLSLSSASTTIYDFSSSAANTLGGVNGIAPLSGGLFGMFSGDFNANGQVQNTDVNGLVPSIGTSGYQMGDLNLNGQVQNTDLQNFLILNLGKGAQYNY